MKLSCSAYQAGSFSAQKILAGHSHSNYGATSSTANTGGPDGSHGITMPSWKVEEVSPSENPDSPTDSGALGHGHGSSCSSHSDLHGEKANDSSRSASGSPGNRYENRSKSISEQNWTNLRAVLAWYSRLRRIKRTKSNQRWMKLRTTVQLSGAITSTIKEKPKLKREDSFLKRFSTRQQQQEDTFDCGDEDEGGPGGGHKHSRKKRKSLPKSVVNPDGSFFFYWLMLLTLCVLYNLWTLIVRQSFPELQENAKIFWILADIFTDVVFLLDIAVQFRTGYLEQGLMVFKTKKLAKHYMNSRPFVLDLIALTPTDLLQLYYGSNPLFRFPRFIKIYRICNYYYMFESRTVYPNVWRVVNLVHILLLLAHWFGCFYYLLSEWEDFQGPWVYPDPGDPDRKEFAGLTRKYLGSLYWSTLTLTTIGDLPTPYSNWQYLFTILSYLIGVFIFATIVGQVGNVITNRNANRLEFERLLDGAKMYMRHHKVPRDMQRRVLRWYDYSWSRGRIQGGGDINTALGLLPDKLKTELALHVNLSVLKKVTIFQECQPEFLHDLVLKMKAYIFTPGDLICRKGEVAREMFIIADGILEVHSESGKVLTTMQAGDFFGEIGILNLDGLNKRTADVRSVGYSELFSLSREDVLGAMKDYPEAQEILQTLGRKRLMEARKANAPPPAKKTETLSPPAVPGAKKSSVLSIGQNLRGSDPSVGEPSGSDSNSTGKRIVEKLRSDVKGLKNAIRKSRKSNSSKDDSSEPDSGSGDGRPRGVLKRMHNVVTSDEKKDQSGVTSPPGTTSSIICSPTSFEKSTSSKKVTLPLVTKALSPPQSSSEGPKEVIGAGLPLFARLKLLKKREEEEEAKKKSVTTTQAVVESSISNSSTASEKKTLNPLLAKILTSKASSAPTPSSAGIEDPNPEPEGKSIKTIEDIISTNTEDFHQVQLGDADDEDEGEDEPETDPDPVILKKNSKMEGSSSLRGAGLRRPSALHFRAKTGKTYQSVEDLSPVFSRLPFVKKLQILNERQKIAQKLLSTNDSPVLTRSTSEGSNDTTGGGTSEDQTTTLHSLSKGRRTQSSFAEQFPASDAKFKITAPTSPPSTSPPDNETPERKNLKSILKRLAESAGRRSSDEKSCDYDGGDKKCLIDDNPQLLRAPTFEGFAARHQKFAKNVSFHRKAVTVISPDSPNHGKQLPFSSELPGHSQAPLYLRSDSEISKMKMKVQSDAGFSGEDDEGGCNGGSSRVILDETGEGGESGPFLGLIQSKMNEIQDNFHNRFTNLETEIHRRDQTIFMLQRRIQELEERNTLIRAASASSSGSGRSKKMVNHKNSQELGDDDDDEDDAPFFQGRFFSRGDSIDTVIGGGQDNLDLDDDDDVFAALADDEVIEYSKILRQSLSQENGHPTTWAQAEKETIEMQEFSAEDSAPPLWQYEFHCDPSKESVAVDMGSTEEGEETSSDDEPKVPLKKDSPPGSDEEADGGSSTDTQGELDNTNWEVKLLAKEMERIEEVKEQEKISEELSFGEIKALQSEIREMTKVVKEGTLSPTELDMIEFTLENRVRKVKKLYRAASVDSRAGPSIGKSTSGSGSGGSMTTSYMGYHGNLQSFSRRKSHAAASSFDKSYEFEGEKRHLEISGSGTVKDKPLSPGERLDLQKLMLPTDISGGSSSSSRRKSNPIMRQASLMESGSKSRYHRGSLQPTATIDDSSSASQSRSSFPKRRESTGDMAKSFLSKIGLVKQSSFAQQNRSGESGGESMEILSPNNLSSFETTEYTTPSETSEFLADLPSAQEEGKIQKSTTSYTSSSTTNKQEGTTSSTEMPPPSTDSSKYETEPTS